MIECLTPENLILFMNSIDSSIVEITEHGTVIIHATAGKVEWVYNAVEKMFCIR
jgi:hypothetical protein